MMDYGLTDEQEAIREVARTLADNELRPVAAEYDRTGEFPWPVVEQLAADAGERPAPTGLDPRHARLVWLRPSRRSSRARTPSTRPGSSAIASGAQ